MITHSGLPFFLETKDYELKTTATLEPDGQATDCNPVDVGSIPTGVLTHQLPIRTTS